MALTTTPTTTKPNYQSTKPDGSGWYAPTTTSEGGDISTLYQWGTVQIQVFPLNIHELDHETASDWAHKEIAGAAIYREWVGENDEQIFLRGKIFPYRIGGMNELEHFNAMRRAGVAHQLVRGNGEILGWFICERLVRAHTFLSSEGVGQQIAFEATMARVPVPEADGYLNQIWRTTGAGS
jgi:hypothetical protein